MKTKRLLSPQKKKNTRQVNQMWLQRKFDKENDNNNFIHTAARNTEKKRNYSVSVSLSVSLFKWEQESKCQ